jgi:hypothetical protein
MQPALGSADQEDSNSGGSGQEPDYFLDIYLSNGDEPDRLVKMIFLFELPQILRLFQLLE